MHQFLYLAAAATTEAEGGMVQEIARKFGLETQMFVSQLIIFCIVIYALNRFAYKPVLNMLEHRRKAIEEGLENADKIKEELAKTEAARDEILTKANTQANQLIEEARAAANKVKDSETQKAIASAEQIISKARQATDADRERMMVELKQEIGRLVVQVTAKVAGKVLDDKDQKRLVDEATKEIAA